MKLEKAETMKAEIMGAETKKCCSCGASVDASGKNSTHYRRGDDAWHWECLALDSKEGMAPTRGLDFLITWFKQLQDGKQPLIPYHIHDLFKCLHNNLGSTTAISALEALRNLDADFDVVKEPNSTTK